MGRTLIDCLQTVENESDDLSPPLLVRQTNVFQFASNYHFVDRAVLNLFGSVYFDKNAEWCDIAYKQYALALRYVGMRDFNLSEDAYAGEGLTEIEMDLIDSPLLNMWRQFDSTHERLRFEFVEQLTYNLSPTADIFLSVFFTNFYDDYIKNSSSIRNRKFYSKHIDTIMRILGAEHINYVSRDVLHTLREKYGVEMSELSALKCVEIRHTTGNELR